MRSITVWRGALALMIAILGWSAAPMVSAQQPEATKDDPWEAAKQAAQQGPLDIPLAGQAKLRLPADRVFIPQPHATKLLNAMGNPGEDPRLQGLIFPAEDNAGWFMTVRYESSGYIKDDDAKDWDADELLDSYREGTEENNKERAKMGVPEMEILGWAQPPAYDAVTHRLVWAMKSRDKGDTSDIDLGVNYNTYLLGREGYFSLNLVTDLKSLEAVKPQAHAMLDAVSYDDGKRYADFNASTDHVAEYGLAALVLGVGAKKLGLLAVIAAFVAKFAKVGILVLAGLGVALKRFFGKKSEA